MAFSFEFPPPCSLHRTLPSRQPPGPNLNPNILRVVNMRKHLCEIAHVKPLIAHGAFIETVRLALGNAVNVNTYSGGARFLIGAGVPLTAKQQKLVLLKSKQRQSNPTEHEKRSCRRSDCY